MGNPEKERSARRERRGGRVSEMIAEGQRRRALEPAPDVTSKAVIAPIQKRTHGAVETASMKLKKGITSTQIANACREKLPAAICNEIAAIKNREEALEAALKAFRETLIADTYETTSRRGKITRHTLEHTISGRYFLRNAGILG